MTTIALTADTFQQTVTGDGITLIDFWAEWCGPCRMVAPELDKLAAKVGGVAKFVKVNVDDNAELAARYGVMSIPTIAKFVGGSIGAQVVGARNAESLGRELGLVG